MGALVLALNPSIDAEWRVAQARWEEKNVIQSERRWAGGKGVNVARWLRHLGGKPRLLLPLGGVTGRELAGHLRKERLSANVVALSEPTRVNVIVTTGDGRQLRFNPPGPTLTATEWKSVLAGTAGMLKQTSVLVLSGSLPRGVNAGAYAEIIRLARRQGAKTILDCDGKALTAAVHSRPLLVKPNEHELEEWVGRPIKTEAELVRAAVELSGQTKGWVLVSRGGRGALLVNESLKMRLRARAPRVNAVNTVGAGDALVAAVARQMEMGNGPEDWLRCGVATGAAATQCAAGKLPGATMTRELSRQVVISLRRPAHG
jgi:1-phosphofructokinase family hexose kinase